MAHARRALELLDEDEHLGRGGVAALLGLAYWAGGDLDAAYRPYLEAMASLEKAGHIADLLGLTITLADLRIAQGGLNDAQRRLRTRPGDLDRPGPPALRGRRTCTSASARSPASATTSRRAAQHLRSSQDLGEENGLPQNPYRSRVALARIRQTEGDLDGAIALLDEAERRYDGDFSPDVRPVAATRARVLVVAGRLAEAAAWARDRGLSTTDDLTYLREFEHITLARGAPRPGIARW